MKCKVITSTIEGMEADISAWLQENSSVKVEVITQIVGRAIQLKLAGKTNEDDARVTTTIVYSEGLTVQMGTASDKPLPEVDGEPDCPNCFKPMVLRKRVRDGNPFWGCSDFPQCKGLYGFEEGNNNINRDRVAPAPTGNSEYTEDGDEIPF
ncbi:MAG: topoisomerase DNA-binding C4 zinc finger domain-containing protein [Deltaproteobacteria bacterium]|nr:topoisomerase DNA-binding C4 zinc finger domain-containing protein [Deltaproteobacteria bacterium]